jgi:hypothetical protein
MDSGVFDNVKLDLFPPRRLGETDSVRPSILPETISKISSSEVVVKKAKDAMESLGKSTGIIPPPPTASTAPPPAGV